jgi:hypothetical protein
MTLEPVASGIEEDFTLLYSLKPGPGPVSEGMVAREEAREVVVDPEAEEPPEPLGPGGLDLGEAVAQQLAVALDPYPRAPGAALGPAPGAPETPGTPETPETPGTPGTSGGTSGTDQAGPQRAFAVLEALKRHE